MFTASVFAFIGGLGTMELMIILVILLMLFGVGKLPMVMRQLGGGVKSFQDAVRGEDEENSEPEQLEVEKIDPT
jgi:sec-independent protein translocase protein TatA